MNYGIVWQAWATSWEPGIENWISYFSTKTHVVGTQKNGLIDTVLLSTQNTCLNRRVRKYLQFYAKNVDLLFY